jgi:hypothetical protein
MADERMPYEIIGDMVSARQSVSDKEILAELSAFPPLPDEDDPAWDQDATWQEAYRFVALSDVAASRRLTPAIRLLLDRACYGDPGEMFRGLRHAVEAIVNPRWSELADICLDAASFQATWYAAMGHRSARHLGGRAGAARIRGIHPLRPTRNSVVGRDGVEAAKPAAARSSLISITPFKPSTAHG